MTTDPDLLTPSAPELQTKRLRLRAWRRSDRAPFVAMNADPRVMEHLPAPISAEDFDHPRVPDGHRLQRHVLYRMSARRWAAMSS